MFDKLIAFFMSIIAFITSLFGGGAAKKNYTEYLDVSYGKNSAQKFDLYLPKNKEKTVGLILTIHGGAWISGDKKDYRETEKSIVKDHGYAAASVNYRFLSESVTMQDILNDINSAVNAIYKKAADEGYTIKKMITTGMSAGAHLALMYAYHTPADAKIKPVAVCSQCGPTDLGDPNYYAQGMDLKTEFLPLMEKAAGQTVTEENLRAVTAPFSPVTYVSTAVPTVIAHGKKDTVVPYSNAQTLDRLLTEQGVPHVLISYPNSGHGLDKDKNSADQYYAAFVDYAAKYLK